MNVIAHQGDSVDSLCWRHLGSSADVEQVFEDNPGLAALGAILPEGTPVSLPDATATSTSPQKLIQLWD